MQQSGLMSRSLSGKSQPDNLTLANHIQIPTDRRTDGPLGDMASTSVASMASMASMCHFKVSGGMTWKSDLDAEMKNDIGNREPSFLPPGPGQAFASPDLR